MSNFNIKPLLKIVGVSSASGISYSNGVVRLISDESNYLYEHHISQNKTSKLLLLNNIHNEQIIKSEKLDLESLAETEKFIYTFGSGSTPKRELGFSINKENHQIIPIQLNHLYSSMRTLAEIDLEDFNIESAISDGKDWIFLNRGNGPNNRNILFKIHGESLEKDFQLSSTEFNLPPINNLPSGFSDATIVNNKLYFITTAEAGTSTYFDGEVGGSMIGAIDLESLEIKFSMVISNRKKFEGITFYKQENPHQISFLLCEDNDDKVTESTVYQLEINLGK